jgi:hypothetical protein
MQNGGIIGPAINPSSSNLRNSGVWDADDNYSLLLNNRLPRVISSGLVLYLDSANTDSYPGYGTTWYDLSPSGLNFTGSDASFLIPSNGLRSGNTWASASTAILNTDTHSIFFNIKFNTTTTFPQSHDGNWQKMFSYNPAGSDRSPSMWRYPSERKIHWRYDAANSSADLAENIPADAGGTQFAADIWYYVGVVKNGATATMYVNGTSIGSQTVTNPKFAGNSPIYLFESYTSGLASMDNIKIYNRSISATEVSQNYLASQNRLSKTPVGYLIVGGGGGGGMDMGGGGGAGGYVSGNTYMSPGTYNVSVGAGGTGAPAAGTSTQGTGHQFTISATKGSDSYFYGSEAGNITALGGGFGGSSYFDYTPNNGNPSSGGSGGGSSGYSNGTAKSGGATIQSSIYGYGLGSTGGGATGQYYGGGGGGAGAVGLTSSASVQADGGVGVLNSILGTDYYWCGGGGGSGYSREGGNGGNGGGGAGAVGSKTGGSGFTAGSNTNGGGINSWANSPGGNGGFATGGGGGGGSHYTANNKGGHGGSGSVILRYPSYYPDLVVSPGLIYQERLFRNYKIYHFTAGTGTFVLPEFRVIEDRSVDYLIVAGGGGGGSYVGGGGGGGGIVLGTTNLRTSSSYTLTVGAGGATNANGSNSTFVGNSHNIIALGGGTGANYADGSGADGGSGGGHGGSQNNGGRGGFATQLSSASGGYGNNGAASTNNRPSDVTMGGGGGGAGTKPDNNASTYPGDAGAGLYSDILGTGYYWSAGGGGGAYNPGSGGSPARSGNGGQGGGGNGGCFASGTVGTIGTGGLNSATQTTLNQGGSGQGIGGAGGVNTGSGGGGCGHADVGGSGGSGIIVLRFPNTYPDFTSIGAGLTYQKTSITGFTVYRFTAGTGTVTI